MPYILDERLRFPDPRTANDDGLVAIGGDLSVPRLQLAYRCGIFPWTVNPISWWSPDPRGIIDLERFHVPRRLARFMRTQPFEITRDRAFCQVMLACALPSPGRMETWIEPEFIDAYTRLFEQGHAHSVECWREGVLEGGIYGVSVGGLFAGESMFHRASNGSKVALCHLVEHLKARGFVLFDTQVLSPATLQLGGVEISRKEYLDRLNVAVQLDRTFC